MSDDARARNVRAALTLQQICLFANVAMTISREDVDNVLSELNRYDVVMPILDPTAYRDNMGNATEKGKLAAAFSTFHEAVSELVVERSRT